MKERWNARLETRRYIFCQGKKAAIALILFLGRDSRYLFVSGSWYCQIQTTKLIKFFRRYLYLNKKVIFRPTQGIYVQLINCNSLIVYTLGQLMYPVGYGYICTAQYYSNSRPPRNSTQVLFWIKSSITFRGTQGWEDCLNTLYLWSYPLHLASC